MPSVLLLMALAAAPHVKPPANAPVPLVGIAPSLSANAFRDELRAGAARRQEELAAIARQRAELEKLGAEIAAARAALEAEKGHREGSHDDKRPPSRPEPRPISVASMGTSPEVLAKTVKSMKPDQAVALVLRLDRGLAVEVLRRMRPADAGAILDRMKGETAAELFSLMAAARTSSAQSSVR